MKKISIFLAFFWAVLHSAQLSSYNSMSLNYKFHPKFFIFGEIQLRGIEDFSYPDYYEVKGGLGYNLTSNHKPLLGIGRYATYSEHNLDKEEFRIWLQDVVNVQKGVVKFENRVRAEKSWFYEPDVDKKSGRTRFRYRLNVSVPLNKKKIEPGTISVNAYNEVFFTPSKTEHAFSRNRLYSGLGYQIDETIGLAGGYLWQREFASKGNKNINFIYFALNFNIDSTDDEKDYSFPSAD
ncbi:DUF2490 domain-containing protein [Chryseobacterium sp. A301]